MKLWLVKLYLPLTVLPTFNTFISIKIKKIQFKIFILVNIFIFINKKVLIYNFDKNVSVYFSPLFT